MFHFKNFFRNSFFVPPELPSAAIVRSAGSPGAANTRSVDRHKCHASQTPEVPDAANVRMSQIRKYRGSGYRKCPYVDYYKCASQRHEKKEKNPKK
jgi:hypothetical protein